VNLGLSHKTKVTMATHYKEVSSIMIHFWHSISISITDTFRVYQYHKPLMTVIHLLEFRNLLARFAISVKSHISQFILELKASTDITILCLSLMALTHVSYSLLFDAFCM